MASPTSRFDHAIALIDAENALDPNGGSVLYGQRMTRWIERLDPQASEALRLAGRAQHIRRWDIPRDSYPDGRAGYHAWRKRLYEHHAQVAGRLLATAGYDAATIAAVGEMLRKTRIKLDPDAQTLEDAAALVFLEFEFADFRARKDYDAPKWINILRRTWAKMSANGQGFAMRLPLDAESLALVRAAVGESSGGE